MPPTAKWEGPIMSDSECMGGPSIAPAISAWRKPHPPSDGSKMKRKKLTMNKKKKNYN